VLIFNINGIICHTKEECKIAIQHQKIEKVTFDIPSELKQDVIKLKNELKVSLNTIYNNAIAGYAKKQELKRWEQAAIKASKNREYINDLLKLSAMECFQVKSVSQDRFTKQLGKIPQNFTYKIHQTVSKTLNPFLTIITTISLIINKKSSLLHQIFAFLTLHFSYGFGSLVGLFKILDNLKIKGKNDI
jgi:predicted AlkP superfamily phosphohydrolase/phosphomutase